MSKKQNNPPPPPETARPAPPPPPPPKGGGGISTAIKPGKRAMRHRTSRRSILGEAHDIAYKVTKVDPDYRGFLFKAVAEKLQERGQHYTANLFRSAALVYGVKEPPEAVNNEAGK